MRARREKEPGSFERGLRQSHKTRQKKRTERRRSNSEKNVCLFPSFWRKIEWFFISVKKDRRLVWVNISGKRNSGDQVKVMLSEIIGN